MNNNVKTILAFVGGVVVGGTAAYFAAGKFLSDHYEKQALKEIEEVREYYNSKYSRAPYVETDLQKANDEEFRKLVEQTEEYHEIVAENYSGDPSDAYLKQLDEDNEGEKVESDGTKQVYLEGLIPEEEEEPVEDKPEHQTEADESYFSELQEMIKNRTPDRPYIISVGEYNHEEDGGPTDAFGRGPVKYDKLALIYWDGDDTLADEAGNIYAPEEVDRIVGTDNLTNFGKMSAASDIVYVRNEKLESDYEIRLDEQAYTDALYNLTPKSTPPKNLRFKQEE